MKETYDLNNDKEKKKKSKHGWMIFSIIMIIICSILADAYNREEELSKTYLQEYNDALKQLDAAKEAYPAKDNEIEKLNTEISNLNSEINNYKEKYSLEYDKNIELQNINNGYLKQIEFMDKYIALVNCNSNTMLYHTYNCKASDWSNCESYWGYNIDLAQSKGYSACPDCH